jgi:hypothetical protein
MKFREEMLLISDGDPTVPVIVEDRLVRLPQRAQLRPDSTFAADLCNSIFPAPLAGLFISSPPDGMISRYAKAHPCHYGVTTAIKCASATLRKRRAAIVAIPTFIGEMLLART